MSTGPLYAMGGAHALTGFATGNREGKPNQREQEIGTPDCLLAVVRQAFGQEINLDPCANPARPIALSHYFGERYDTGKKHKDGTAKMAWRGDGLTSPWADKTFFNSPYENLSDWLEKSFDETKFEQIGLFPVRPNRQWWCSYMASVNAHAYLKPLKFEGYKQAFPAPLCLAYIGSRKEEFENAVRVSGLATHISLGGI